MNSRRSRKPRAAAEALDLTLPGALVPVLLDETVPALDPEVLEPVTRQALQELMRAGESANTVRSYRAALRYWAGWFQLRYRRAVPMPLPVPAVVQFIVDHAQRPTAEGLSGELPAVLDQALVHAGLKARPGPLALATLEHRLSVLSKVHRLQGPSNPCQAAEVRELMSRVRRVYAQRGERSQPKPALTREPLEALLATCDHSLIGVRDRALLLFAWGSGGRRRSEVAAARVEQLKAVRTGEFIFRMSVSKTNQAGEDLASNDKPMVGRVGQALQDWLQAAQLTSGPLFRRIRRGGHVGPEGLSEAAVRDIVRQRASLAGLAPSYSAHSLRSGFITESSHRQVPLPEAMAMSGHRSLKSFQRYYRPDATRYGGATLLDDPPDKGLDLAEGGSPAVSAEGG